MNVSSKLDLKLTFKGLDSTEAIKSYSEKRISKLTKHLHNLVHCEFVFSIEKTQQIAQLHVVSGDFEAKAQASAESLYTSIDEVVEKMIQQTRKYKEKTTSHAGKAGQHHNHSTKAEESDQAEQEEQE